MKINTGASECLISREAKSLLQQWQLAVKRLKIRDIIGDKTVREITLK